MREIRFRGKKIDTGEWIYGYLCFVYVDVPSKSSIYDPKSVRNYDVRSDTVGQYTGLKDKNGNEIYEGDIVRCWGGEYCQGYWEHDNKIPISSMINDCFMMGESEHIEIIDTIYNNKEATCETEVN